LFSLIFPAATTFDITRLLGDATRVLRLTKIISLLQPPPETVANFNELILLGEGKIIYSGPVNEVIDYFNSLGYEIPERMDVADWLQVSKEMTRHHLCRGNILTSVSIV
jgi:ABC-type multidrug transport system ATPase subunit